VNSETGSESGLRKGEIAGIAVGVASLVLLVLLGLSFAYRHRKRKAKRAAAFSPIGGRHELSPTDAKDILNKHHELDSNGPERKIEADGRQVHELGTDIPHKLDS
jgi:hypothetical protein